MKIDEKYMATLLEPLEGNNILSLEEYLKKLENLGVVLKNSMGGLDETFETHLSYMSHKKMISNLKGNSDLYSLGILMIEKHSVSVLNSTKIMKVEKEETTSNSTFNFNGPVTNQQAQFGNGNTQNVTINMQELVEKVAASDDKEAKGILMKLLENPTISGVIGAGVSGLIGILGGG